jgi:hypothetical protein
MPHLRSATTTTIGLLTGFVTSVLVFFTHFSALQSMVYSTYLGLITTFQFYELAWILATLEFLLNFSNPFTLLLWVIAAIVLALIIRKVTTALSAVIIAVLFPGGIWFLFGIKYAAVLGFSSVYLLSFLLWQLLLPLTVVSLVASMTAFPFWVLTRGSITQDELTKTVKFACSNCDAIYRSKPVICVECGKEGLVRENSV